jgi:UDP-N-acetylmuramate--alanine ligase
MVEDRAVRIESYGIEGSSFWRAENIRRDAAGATFDLFRAGLPIGELRLPLPGDHFIRDAVAAAAVCLGEGVLFGQIAGALANVHGAHRRFERKGEANGITVMDSYAHHPTEARADIEASRTAFPGRRLIVVYQPHTYSRIAYLWDEWTSCWAGVDELIVLETYAAREAPEAGRSAPDLAAAITNPKARYARDFDDAVRQAVELARPGDVIFTMGAGDVVEVGPRILEALR